MSHGALSARYAGKGNAARPLRSAPLHRGETHRSRSRRLSRARRVDGVIGHVHMHMHNQSPSQLESTHVSRLCGSVALHCVHS